MFATIEGYPSWWTTFKSLSRKLSLQELLDDEDGEGDGEVKEPDAKKAVEAVGHRWESLFQ